MDIAQIVLVVYGALLFMGAYYGGKAKSKVSVVMGAVFGVLVLFGAVMAGIAARFGYVFLMAVTAVLSVVFLVRFIKTRKVVPSGMLLAVSLGAFLLSLNQFRQVQF